MNDVYIRSFPLSAGTKLPNVAIEDTGKLVDYVIRHGSRYQTKSIAFFFQELSEAEKAATIGKSMLCHFSSIWPLLINISASPQNSCAIQENH